MQQVKQNESTAARRRFPVYLVDDTDGKTPETGVTLSAGDMKISKNGGAEANHAGTLVELAGGGYYYEASSGEVDTLGYLTGRIVKSGVRTFNIAAQVVVFDPYDAVRLGLTALPNAAANTAGGLASAVHRAGTLPAQTGADPGAGTVNLAAGGIGADDELIGQLLVVFSAVFTIRGVGIITDSVDSTDRVTLNGGTALTFTPAENDTYAVLALPGVQGLTEAQVASAVLDAVASSYDTAGSIGEAINNAGTAADPWATAIPGAYGAGTAGERLGRIPNAAAGGNGGLPTVDASNRIAGIQGTLNTLDAIDAAQDSQHDATRALLPAALVSGRLDVSVGAYQTGLTPLQPTVAGRTLDVTAGGAAGIDWANVENPTTAVGLSGTTIATSQVVASVAGAVGSVTGNVGGNVAGSVGSVTGNVGGNLVGSLSASERNAIADALLNRDMGAVTVTNSRSPINALRMLRNGYSISGTTLTVFEEDGSTPAYTMTLTGAPGADPISAQIGA